MSWNQWIEPTGTRTFRPDALSRVSKTKNADRVFMVITMYKNFIKEYKIDVDNDRVRLRITDTGDIQMQKTPSGYGITKNSNGNPYIRVMSPYIDRVLDDKEAVISKREDITFINDIYTIGLNKTVNTGECQ